MTYTNHLMSGLGDKAMLFTLSPKKTELYPRKFKASPQFDNMKYNVCWSDMDVTIAPTLVTAIGKAFAPLIMDWHKQGAWLVIHDPTEFKYIDKDQLIQERVIVIRRTMLQHLPRANHVPHPYSRFTKPFDEPKKKLSAICISRIDYDKNIDIILHANRILPTDDQIQIRGFENRFYSKFRLMPEFPEWVQQVWKRKFRETECGFTLSRTAKLVIDLSSIKNDGGGTQYTFLEAVDAGVPIILNKLWLTANHNIWKPGINCWAAVSTPQELVAAIKSHTYAKADAIAAAAKAILKNHDSVRIANQVESLILTGVQHEKQRK